MEQWHKCPKCNQDILESIVQCPKCGDTLNWIAINDYKCVNHPDRQATHYCAQCHNYICDGCQKLVSNQVYCFSCGNKLLGIDPVSGMTAPQMIDNVKAKVRRGEANIIIEGVKTPIVLKPSEELLVAMPQFNIIEPRAIRNTNAIYGGPTFRIAKGLSFRLGAAHAKGESHEELRTIDSGIFTLTTQRVVFSGSKRTITISLGKIMAIEAYSSTGYEGVGVRKDTASKMQYFTCSNTIFDALTLNFKLGSLQVTEKFNGQWLVYILEGAMQKYAGRATQKSDAQQSDSALEQIKMLDELFKAGALTKEEFESKKTDLLKRI
jgi:hypothetical protein